MRVVGKKHGRQADKAGKAVQGGGLTRQVSQYRVED